MSEVTLTTSEMLSITEKLNQASETIAQQRRELEAAHKLIKEISDEDYRGNRSSASVKAYHFLEALKKRKANAQ